MRSASALLPPYNPAAEQMVFGAVSGVDYGDAPTVPGYIEDTLGRVEGYVSAIHAGGALPLGIGGDDSVTLANLRAAAKAHRPLGLVHLDWHHDVWDGYFGRPLNHGTVFKRACDEGLLDPARCVQAGMRGGVYDGGRLRHLGRARHGDLIPWQELRAARPRGGTARACASCVGDRRYLTFDVDFVDPAFCAGHRHARGRRADRRPRRSTTCARCTALDFRGARRRRGRAAVRRRPAR